MIRTLSKNAHLIAVLALLLMAGLLVHAALVDSPTFDEHLHATRGLAYLTTGDARLSFAHPALPNLLQALPGWAVLPRIDFTHLPGWATWDVAQVSAAWMEQDYEQVRIAILGGRLVTVVLTLLLGLYLYRFASRFGRLQALFTVYLVALHPLFLAHGHLATTDMPVTLAMTVATGEFVRWISDRSRWRLLTFALAAGAAFAAKYSAIALVPALGVAGIVMALSDRGPWAGRPLGARLGRLARDVAAVTAIACLVVCASYGFQRTGWTVQRTLEEPEPINWVTERYEGELLEKFSVLPALPAWLPVPLPYPWLFGAHTILAHDSIRHSAWFLGEKRNSRLYFPTLAPIKNPLATLLLLLGAAYLAIQRRRFPPREQLAFWTVSFFLFGTACLSDIQIGARHVMPIFPFLVLAAAWAAAQLTISLPAAAAVILALAAAETLAAAPRFLGHFSWAIGGERVGHRVSMVAEDWGQDVRAFARLVRERDLQPLLYRPYGVAAPYEMRREGVPFRSFECDETIEGPAWVAMHGSEIVRGDGACAGIASDTPPAFTIAEHIRVYRVEATPQAAPVPVQADQLVHDQPVEPARSLP